MAAVGGEDADFSESLKGGFGGRGIGDGPDGVADRCGDLVVGEHSLGEVNPCDAGVLEGIAEERLRSLRVGFF